MKKNQILYKQLSSTQRLPKSVESLSVRGISFVCNGCSRRLCLPPGLTLGHARCRFCGKIHRIGIPSDYVRIVCDCGKILTASKRDIGKKGTCPGCKKVWTVSLPGQSVDYTLEPSQALITGRYQNKLEHSQNIQPRSQEQILAKPEVPILPKITQIQGKESLPKNASPNCDRPIRKEETLESNASPIQTEATPFQKQDVAFSGPIHFKCQCGQSHLVEDERRGTSILCFRCGQEVKVPYFHENEKENPIHPDSSVARQFAVIDILGTIETAYPETELFRILHLNAESSLEEIKQACRSIQFQVSRKDPIFQIAQDAKDCLTKPEKRIRYEILSGSLVAWWKGIANAKWLKLHDYAVLTHREAIEKEKERSYRKADNLSEKAIKSWLKLAQTQEFWKAASQRGEQIFTSKKFKLDVVTRLQSTILDDVIVKVSCQFRDRYLAEKNALRAQSHLKRIVPVLKYLYHANPEDEHTKTLLIAYFFEETKSLALEKRWKQTRKVMQEMQSLFPDDPEARRIMEQYQTPA